MSGKPAIKVVFGAMTIGEAGREGIRVSTVADTRALLSAFRAHGHTEVDTARVYGGGTTEEFLGAADWQSLGIRMETKFYPTLGKGMSWLFPKETTLAPADVRQGLLDSLRALKTDKVHAFYLHGPDRASGTPIADTLRAVDALHREGLFDVFGLSNFQAWEVAQVVETCRRNGWVAPTVYQGLYNAQHRAVEAELVPCLRHYGLALYVFNPLAGGFLTGRYARQQAAFEDGERFDPNRKQGQLHRGRYWNEANFQALDLLRPACERHGISVGAAALRWLAHHSALRSDLGDAVIVGASGVAHLEENLSALEQGPLPPDVVEALEKGWELTRGLPLKYWH